MIFSDLASPAGAGFAKAGNRHPSPIQVEDMLFGIMRQPFQCSTQISVNNRRAVSMSTVTLPLSRSIRMREPSL